MRQLDDPIFAGLLEAAPDATVCVDESGRIVLVNAQAERLFGYPREELAGQPVEILVPDASKAAHSGLRAGYAADPRPRQMDAGLDLSARRRDGTTFPAEISLSAIDTGQGILVSAAVRDVTRQRQADARFRGLLEAAPDATVCVDESGRIVLVNAQAERLFGYPREELAGQPVEILVPDASKAAHSGLRAGYAADPQPRQMGAGLDLSARRRDGTTFPAEIALSAIDTDQGLLVSAAVRDVTQQRQARDDLRRTNQNLHRSATPAHDLRTPLRSRRIQHHPDGGLRRYLGERPRLRSAVEAASEHMGHILDDLLHLSHVPGPRSACSTVDLGAEVAAIAAGLQRQIRAATSAHYPAAGLGTGHADLIREVLHNLLDNAWKFTGDRDSALIEFGMTPARTPASAATCATTARASTRIRAQAVPAIPAPAHQAKNRGTGIGLASVRQIVDRQNGRTWAEGTSAMAPVLLHPPGSRTSPATR